MRKLFVLVLILVTGCATTTGHAPYCSVCRQPVHAVSTEIVNVPLRDTRGRFVSGGREYAMTIYTCRAGHQTTISRLTLVTQDHRGLPPVPKTMQAVILP